jgi:hypothetical protein
MFRSLCRYVTGMLIKAVTPKPQGDLVNGSSELSMSASENSLLLQYKDLIREQDCRLQELTQSVNRLTAEKSTLQVGCLHMLCSRIIRHNSHVYIWIFCRFVLGLCTLDTIHSLVYVKGAVFSKLIILLSSGKWEVLIWLVHWNNQASTTDPVTNILYSVLFTSLGVLRALALSPSPRIPLWNTHDDASSCIASHSRRQ